MLLLLMTKRAKSSLKMISVLSTGVGEKTKVSVDLGKRFSLYWERGDLLAFRLCCFTLCRLDVLCSFSVWCLGRMWNSIVSVPDHCLFIYYKLKNSKLGLTESVHERY